MSESETIAIQLNRQEWAIIRAGIYELPIKIGLPTLVKLDQQLQSLRPQPELQEAAE